MEVLCPEATPKEQIAQCHPVIIDMLRTIFTFLVKQRFYGEAIKLANRMIDVFIAFDLESGLCKAMASISVLQLAQGDVVKVCCVSIWLFVFHGFQLSSFSFMHFVPFSSFSLK
jgi:hypothetical protein